MFTSKDFTATQWNTADDKAKFANHLIRFVKSGYKKTLFYHWFYRRLSMTFGHIAHYDRGTFYSHFFESEQHMKVSFGHSLMTGGGFGDPSYTYSDVEKTIHKWAQHYNATKGWC